jgi:hypothetical protein
VVIDGQDRGDAYAFDHANLSDCRVMDRAQFLQGVRAHAAEFGNVHPVRVGGSALHVRSAKFV